MLEHNENLGLSVDLVRIKLYLIKPITVAEKQPIATLLIKPIEYKAKQRYLTWIKLGSN